MGGHLQGHDHHEQLDDVLATSAHGMRTIELSLVALAATAVVQLVIVLLSGSVALLADTVHNSSDALTAIPLWIAFTLARRPPTERYPYGYHRAEDLAGLLIVLLIAASAAFAAWEAAIRLMRPRPVHALGWVAAAAVVGAIGNELVAIYRIRVGRRIGSAALVADGEHARIDGLTSLGVLVGAIGVAFGFDRADALAGLAITLVILFVLKDAARSVFHRIMDGTDASTVGLLEEVAAAVPGVEHVTSARARWAGHGLNAELDIQVDPKATVESGHEIAESVEHALLHDVPRLRMATVHVDPHDHDRPPGPTAHHRRD